jgi:acyl carrier protein
MRDTVSRWLSDLLVREFGISPGELSSGTTLEEVGLDPLDLFELAEAIERSTGVILEDAVVRRLHTIGELDAEVAKVRGRRVFPTAP